MILIECFTVFCFALQYRSDVLSSCSQFGDSVVHYLSMQWLLLLSVLNTAFYTIDNQINCPKIWQSLETLAINSDRIAYIDSLHFLLWPGK